MISSVSQRPLFRVTKQLRETDDSDECALDATIASGGASPFTPADGHRRDVMVGRCLAGTNMALRIANLSCTAAIVEGMFWINLTALLFVFYFFLFLIAMALDFAVLTFSRSAV